MEEKVTIEGESMMEEKVTIEGESMREEKATMERGNPVENETEKGGLEDTDQKAVDGQKEGGWVPFDTVPEDDQYQIHCKEIFPLAKNYIIFFGTVTLMHSRGQELALPPPI